MVEVGHQRAAVRTIIPPEGVEKQKLDPIVVDIDRQGRNQGLVGSQ